MSGSATIRSFLHFSESSRIYSICNYTSGTTQVIITHVNSRKEEFTFTLVRNVVYKD